MANRKYDQELKNDVIDAVLIGSKSAAQVARDHDIPESAVYSWIRSYKEKHDIAKMKLNNETPEQEITRLKAEPRIQKAVASPYNFQSWKKEVMKWAIKAAN